MTARNIGIALIVAAYALLLLTALAAPHGTGHSHHLDPVFTAQYAAPWPVDDRRGAGRDWARPGVAPDTIGGKQDFTAVRETARIYRGHQSPAVVNLFLI